ncbi:MAG: HmuY family protein [Deltaproteobacteria bacterium]|nr:HmuY family protein [Deltaproteobacteria bacterium]
MKRDRRFALLLVLPAVACAPVDGGDDAAGTGQPDAGGQQAICTMPNTPLPCEDQNILQLSLHDFVSSGAVDNSESGGVFTSTIDARAGGMSEAPQNPFVYAKFTETGLVKVELDDETALGSMDWDLMARRFVVLLNGGDIGPSCVGAAPVAGGFDDLVAPPDGAGYGVEDTFGEPDACALQTDTRYTLGDPRALLMDWWTYDTCVATSGQVFALRLADGRFVKLVIDAYYGSGQEACNTGGTAGTNAAVLTLRWAWL